MDETTKRGKATDAVLIALGGKGRFDLIQLTLLQLSCFTTAFNMLNIVFIGPDVPHKCAPPPNSSNSWHVEEQETVIYEQCSQGHVFNLTNSTSVFWQPCQHGWQYETPRDLSIVSEFDLVCEGNFLSQLTQSLFIVGQGIGAVLFPALSDKFGRRKILLAIHMGLSVLGLALGLVPNYTGFAVIRIITGCLHQGVVMIASAYCVEMFVTSDRLMMGYVGIIIWSVALSIMVVPAYALRHHSWRTLQMVLNCTILVPILHFFFLEESIRWLIANNRMRETQKVIKRAARMNGKDYHKVMDSFNNVMDEVDDKPNLQNQYGQGHLVPSSVVHDVQALNILDLFHHCPLTCYLFISWFMWFTDSMTYFSLFLSSSFLHSDKYINFLLNALSELPTALFFWLLVDRVGRKKTLVIFHLLGGIPLLLVTILKTFLVGTTVEISSTILAFIGKFGISGAFSTLFFYTPEIFPTNLRNLGIGTSSMAARVGGMLAPFAEKLAEVCPWAPGIIFSVCCFIVTILLMKMPETKGKVLPNTIEDVRAWQKGKSLIRLKCLTTRNGNR